MPADSAAAAPGVSGANESDNQGTDTTAEGTVETRNENRESQEGEHEESNESRTVGSRASALLAEMGISEEVRNEVGSGKPEGGRKEATTEEQTYAEAKKERETADAASAAASKGIESGRQEAGSGKSEAGKQEGDPEEKPLTEEEKKSWPKEALDRIHKLTAKRETHKAARAEAEGKTAAATQRAQQLQQQLQNATRVRPEPTQRDPLADVMNAQDLRGAIQYYEQILEFGEMNPDGATDVAVGKGADGKDLLRDFSAKETAAMRVEAGRILRQAVPAKEKFLQEQQLHEQYARATLPAMFEEGTEEHQATQQLYQILPELRSRVPGHQQWVAWAMIGRQMVKNAMEQAKAKEAGSGKSEVGAGSNGKEVDPKVAPFLQKHPPMAPGVPRSGAGVVSERKSKDSAQREAVDEFAAEGGNDDALERLVARTRALQANPRRDAALV